MTTTTSPSETAAPVDTPMPVAAPPNRFDANEVDEFSLMDSQAGRMLGNLLAGLFVLSVVLMFGVTVWTAYHQNISDDPHASLDPRADVPNFIGD